MPPNQLLHFANTAFDVVAFAASAGGVTALISVVSALPAKFPAAIVVVQHLDPHHRSLLVQRGRSSDRICDELVATTTSFKTIEAIARCAFLQVRSVAAMITERSVTRSYVRESREIFDNS